MYLFKIVVSCAHGLHKHLDDFRKCKIVFHKYILFVTDFLAKRNLVEFPLDSFPKTSL